MDVLVFIVICLVILALPVAVIYWGLKQMAGALKPKIDEFSEQKDRMESLEKRIDVLERKLDEK
ncbi:hypothetical protein [Salimicrobium humidisoli]|uniref:Phage shock protein B n=1 Tax=Salimicrobium humidisoli TaxID=2029857 RepID=A0ABX4HTY2_9BACI|nr:hypothetical protein [Salimicrobium humidisoli]PBB06279.1 hypothetical protein CKW00_04415 [Salimicrobium humidisoli]